MYQRSCSLCYVLNFYFYIFENLIDIIIFLDILLSLIVALFKYLFYVIKIIFFITTILPFQNAVLKILIEILISHKRTCFCLTNNFFTFGKKETISVTFTPSSSITSYNLVIFYFIGAILSSTFYKKIFLTLQNNFFHFWYIFSLF